MPLFRLNIQSLSRSTGRSAVAAAAYRAGERIRDQRTGTLHNYSARKDVVHREILLPGSAGANVPDWATDRARLWNEAEGAERRRDSCVAREYQVALPCELGPSERLSLAREFAHEIADRYGVLVDLAIHDPKPEGNPRNYHAHLLTTTRVVSASGFGNKTGLDLSFEERLNQGLQGHREFHHLRERWAVLTNEAYRAAGLNLRVDHRSLVAQGIDREPRHLPYGVYQREQRRMRRDIADILTDRYRERIAANQLSQASQISQVSETPQNPPAAPAAQPPDSLRDATAPVHSRIEELQRQARESWLSLRQKSAADGTAAPSPELDSQSRADEEDLAL
jgi:ATP-dependent exoDNAse (exonuclease V) alpha subunit